MIVEDSTVTTDSLHLYYRVAGTTGPWVIAPFALFHETALDTLADAGFRVVTYDPRGRGRSDPARPEQVSLSALLGDFDAVRRAVGADSVAAIGWSGGGMETFVYALRNPGRITRLVQLAPVAPRFVPYGALMIGDRVRRTDTLALGALRRGVAADSVNTAAYCRREARLTNPALLHDTALVARLPDACRWPNEYPGRLGAYFGGLFASIDGYDWRDSLRAVPIPRLVIHGASDNIPLEGNREWIASQPNARLLVIDGAGHWPHYEQQGPTVGAIIAFLRGEWPAGAISDSSATAPAFARR